MKIGVLTQPLKSNYGGILQNWALQQALIKLGHEPITIDYQEHDDISIWIKINVYRFLKFIVRFKNGYKYSPLNYRRPEIFESFVQENIIKTKRINGVKKSIISKYGLESLIVGSDQVWRPCYNKHYLYEMFFSFANKSKIKRFSYAASFGTDNWEYTKEQTTKCAKLVQLFQAVSVREESAIKLCREKLRIKATQVLDPTLLIGKDDYMNLISDTPSISKKPFLVSYLLNPSEEQSEYINKKAKELRLFPYIFHADNNSVITPKQWISLFRDADYIITDSFHGAVFSIIFQKPFEALGNAERGNARFDLIRDLMSNGNVEDLRRESIDWLKKQLD